MKADAKAGKRILLVESEAPLRRSLENFLRTGGYSFRSCSSGCDALKLAREFRPHVAVVEYRLPDACGMRVIDELMRKRLALSAAVIAEYDFQWLARDFARSNVECYLKKPFDPVELESVLRTCCLKVEMFSPNVPMTCEGCPPSFWDDASRCFPVGVDSGVLKPVADADATRESLAGGSSSDTDATVDSPLPDDFSSAFPLPVRASL